MCADDDVWYVNVADEFRRARKEHRCYACRELIPPGDLYHFVAAKGDDFETFKHCLRCWAIITSLWEAGAQSVQFDLKCGTSWEDEFESAPPDDVAALAFMTRQEAQDKLFTHEGRRR